MHLRYVRPICLSILEILNKILFFKIKEKGKNRRFFLLLIHLFL